jgi:hypothetical protein
MAEPSLPQPPLTSGAHFVNILRSLSCGDTHHAASKDLRQLLTDEESKRDFIKHATPTKPMGEEEGRYVEVAIYWGGKTAASVPASTSRQALVEEYYLFRAHARSSAAKVKPRPSSHPQGALRQISMTSHQEVILTETG